MNELKSLFKSIGSRIKKYLWVVILIPVLATVLSLFAEPQLTVQKKTDPYLATAEIQLGQFGDDQVNNPDQSIYYLKSTSFLKSAAEEHGIETDVEELKQRLEVVKETNRHIKLTYIGDDKGALDTLEAIVNSFMSLSEERYSERVEVAQTSIEELQDKAVAPEAEVEKDKFLYQLKADLTAWNDAQLTEPVQLMGEAEEEVIQAELPTSDPVNRAVLGLLVGIMLVVVIIVTPEIFVTRNERL
ncbi:hypothetical protein ACOJQI_20295 [Bacillus salacetis]|uniref:hypothetical protein n=1 Tax=Bacillus salacetis TaxID=2315464 RepID=UPI003BA16252